MPIIYEKKVPIYWQTLYVNNVNLVRKLLKANSRNEIRAGKLWEITQLWGMDISTVEKEIAKPEAVVRNKVRCDIDAMRVHVITGENNTPNLTKNPDLL